MKLATWNLGDGPDAAKAVGLNRLMRRGVDAIGLQEAGDRTKMLHRWCEATGWLIHYGEKVPGSASVPILWNPHTVLALHTHARPATPATDTGRIGAGPNVVKPKVWNLVRFETDARADLLLINGHLPASVWAPRRRALAKRQIAVLADMVERRERAVDKGRVDVVAVGDFNCLPRDPLTRPLRKLGMKQRTKRPTHGRRTIDHAWTLGVAGRVEVIPMPSDHNAAVLTIKE